MASTMDLIVQLSPEDRALLRRIEGALTALREEFESHKNGPADAQHGCCDAGGCCR